MTSSTAEEDTHALSDTALMVLTVLVMTSVHGNANDRDMAWASTLFFFDFDSDFSLVY